MDANADDSTDITDAEVRAPGAGCHFGESDPTYPKRLVQPATQPDPKGSSLPAVPLEDIDVATASSV